MFIAASNTEETNTLPWEGTMFTHTLFSNAKWNKVAFRVLLAKTGRVFMLLVFLLSMVGGSVISVHALTTTFTGGTAGCPRRKCWCR